MNRSKSTDTVIPQLPVKVQMKSGHLKYGVMLDEPAGNIQGWKFISSEHVVNYLLTENEQLVEYIPEASVVSIDQYLK